MHEGLRPYLDVAENMKSFEGQPIIGIFGKTGAGKSTFMTMLMGRKFDVERKGLTTKYRVRSDESSLRHAVIGNTSTSCTLVPTLYEAGGHSFLDMPGFGETRVSTGDNGRVIGIVAAVANFLAINSASHIKCFIVCIAMSSLMEPRLDGIADLIKYLEQQIGSTLEPNQIIFSITVPGQMNDICFDELKARLDDLLTSKRNDQMSDANEIDNIATFVGLFNSENVFLMANLEVDDHCKEYRKKIFDRIAESTKLTVKPDLSMSLADKLQYKQHLSDYIGQANDYKKKIDELGSRREELITQDRNVKYKLQEIQRLHQVYKKYQEHVLDKEVSAGGVLIDNHLVKVKPGDNSIYFTMNNHNRNGTEEDYTNDHDHKIALYCFDQFDGVWQPIGEDDTRFQWSKDKVEYGFPNFECTICIKCLNVNQDYELQGRLYFVNESENKKLIAKYINKKCQFELELTTLCQQCGADFDYLDESAIDNLSREAKSSILKIKGEIKNLSIEAGQLKKEIKNKTDYFYAFDYLFFQCRDTRIVEEIITKSDPQTLEYLKNFPRYNTSYELVKNLQVLDVAITSTNNLYRNSSLLKIDSTSEREYKVEI